MPVPRKSQPGIVSELASDIDDAPPFVEQQRAANRWPDVRGVIGTVSRRIPPIQEAQASAYHVLCGLAA